MCWSRGVVTASAGRTSSVPERKWMEAESPGAGELPTVIGGEGQGHFFRTGLVQFHVHVRGRIVDTEVSLCGHDAHGLLLVGLDLDDRPPRGDILGARLVRVAGAAGAAAGPRTFERPIAAAEGRAELDVVDDTPPEGGGQGDDRDEKGGLHGVLLCMVLSVLKAVKTPLTRRNACLGWGQYEFQTH